MYAVIRHTFSVKIPEPNSLVSRKSTANWIHKCWLFKKELDAITFAISLLDDPLIKANDYLFESAIHQLKENRFYQLGRESIAVAEVEDSPEIFYETDIEDIELTEKEIGELINDDSKKFIH